MLVTPTAWRCGTLSLLGAEDHILMLTANLADGRRLERQIELPDVGQRAIARTPTCCGGR